ncbi:MAG TPA: dienelactone hydrolase family protein [Polyangiales bacterium]|jgi:hypothetical protein|nr:dienelactone hydrolase family protein [Polyangiales bacterium]
MAASLLLACVAACSGDDEQGTTGDPLSGAGTGAQAGNGAGPQAGNGAGASGNGGGNASGNAGASAAGSGGESASNAGSMAMQDPDAGPMLEPTHDPGSCESLPAVTDYAAPGPFADAKMFTSTGPGNKYTLFRPDASLGQNGFKHPIVTWGNGISTTPDEYKSTLTLIATHGFVIIACNDTQAERACLAGGLDWLIAQNDSGDMKGKLDITRELTVGYSWGGGAAIDTANRPNVRATVSLHGMPPRETNAFADMHAPLLLFTSTGDSFVTADKYVTPNYQMSMVQTFYATLQDSTAGHLYPVDEGSVACVAATLGTCQTAKQERAPTIAWLRLWGCNDQNAKKFFYGDDCTLCQTPWTMPQRKMWQ